MAKFNMQDKIQGVIHKYFYNPSNGFLSARALHSKIRLKNSSVKLKHVQEFISNQAVHQIHQRKRIPDQEFNQIRAPGLGQFQLDLLDLSNYARHNKGYRYLLVVEDIYSKYSFVRPLKTKGSTAVLEAMKSIEKDILKNKVILWSFVMDKGTEFNNTAWNNHFSASAGTSPTQSGRSASSVKMYRKDPTIHTTTGLVERRNGFIRELLQKYFTSYNTLKWVDVIQRINENINTTKNRITKHSPQEIWTRKQSNDEIARPAPTQYEVGQRVRLLINHNIFNKKSTGRYSVIVHTIIKKQGLGYFLDGIKRKVFGWELLPVEITEHRTNLETRSSPRNILEQRTINNRTNRINKILQKELQ